MAFKLTNLSSRTRGAYKEWAVDRRVDRLNGWFERRTDAPKSGEDYDHTETVNDYYDLCHEFMEFGWGDSLHFAPITPSETLEDAVIRHQRLMIEKLKLSEGMRVIDIGCGVGGPMRRVAQEAKVNVVCMNNNEYQLKQARSKNIEAGLDHRAEYVHCNFMDMSVFDADSFDAGYAIESTCHAPDKKAAFAQIFRVMKPGARLWGQEMCLTNAFDPDDPQHQDIKKELMRGIALNEIATFAEVNQALEEVGFEVVEASDLDVKEGPSTPWYRPMESRHGSLENFFRRTPLGRNAMMLAIRMLESVRIFPRTSHQVVRFMDRTADAYVNGGKYGIFTPLYCFVAQKPLQGDSD